MRVCLETEIEIEAGDGRADFGQPDHALTQARHADFRFVAIDHLPEVAKPLAQKIVGLDAEVQLASEDSHLLAGPE